MKTKVSQKEWNDKRDQFLCAIITALAGQEGGLNITWALMEAEGYTSELYEVEESPVQQYEKAMFMGQEFDNLSRPIKAEEPTNHIVEPNKKVEDTRPFNPKVVEIFNEFLPKEIAPLAIEAHKHYLQDHKELLNDGVVDLQKALGGYLTTSFKEIDDFYRLWKHTNGNTITATPEQLREWFPRAYENETSELVMLAKEYYIATDGSIKKGILKDSVWYAPANDLYKNEGGENE